MNLREQPPGTPEEPKKLNAEKIAATLSRAGQIIQRKNIDQREQTLVTEEDPPSSLLGRSQPENLHRGHRSTDRSQPPQCAEEHRAENRRGEGPRTAQRRQTRHDRPHYHARLAPGRPQGT